MIRYVKIGNGFFRMQTVTEFGLTKEQEQDIIKQMTEQGWSHYKTIEHQYGKFIQSNVIFVQEISIGA